MAKIWKNEKFNWCHGNVVGKICMGNILCFNGKYIDFLYNILSFLICTINKLEHLFLLFQGFLWFSGSLKKFHENAYNYGVEVLKNKVKSSKNFDQVV